MTDFSIWDQCQLNSDLTKNIDKISESLSITNSKSNVIRGQNSEELKDAYVNSPGPAPDGNSVLKMNSLQAALEGSEESCRTSLTVLDDILKALDDVSGAFYDITSRTNSLMANCENLLEEQHSLQQTVDMLKVTLEPFNGIEDIARSLGIPLEATRQDGSSSEAAANLDPRSPEFQELLTRISLQNRATSMVAKSIRELLEKASRSCVELHQQKLLSRAHSGNSISKSGGPDDSPIESAAIYQKFRGLSFRVRELTLLLRRGDIASAAAVKAVHGNKKADTSDGGSVHVSVRGEEVVNEIKLVYVQIRNELLLPFARDTWLAGLNPNPNPTAESTVSSTTSSSTSTAGAPPPAKGAASLLEKLVESGSGNNLSGKVNQSRASKEKSSSSNSSSVASAAVADVYETWYPPMRSTLSLLSKLYGVVEMAVFEDFARRSIGALHGDLFLVRHLLILREQLVEKHLDFSPTGLAFNRILVGGIGGGGGSLEGFLNKVTAFVGEIPIPSRHGGHPGQVGTHTKSGAKSASPRNVPTDGEEAAFVGDDQHKAASESTTGMAFMRPERMKEMLEAVQAVLLQAAPDLRAIMKLYIESPVARNILLKPILQEYDECVIMSCVDPGQLRRDVEQLLQTVSYTVVSELSH
eukprot:gene27874-36723_t